jgi:two-component system, chemotaxis family, sensor kinase CheA
MNPDFSPEQMKELLDDFYAESDELLTLVRQHLFGAEQARAEGRAATVSEGVYRSVHTLKGIAGIAGVKAAEQLAHALEDLLRGLARGDFGLTSARLGMMLAAVQQLEQTIGAHRLGKPLPDNEGLLRTLQDAGSSAGPVAASPEREQPAAAREADEPGPDPVAALRRRGLGIWRCSFAPSQALDQRGVNVTSVRERLNRIGEIASAVPSFRPDGTMLFLFTVGLPDGPGDPEPWETDGIHFEGIADPAPVSAAAPEHRTAGGDAMDGFSLTPSHIVRVDLERLDDLMRIAGELVIQRARLEQRIQAQFGDDEGLKEIDLGLARSLRALRKAITRVRLVPIAEIFTRVPLVVRDLTAGTGQRVRVVLEGHQTEIDKYVAERLKEPLLHLVRNALSHGIETATARSAAGKPAEATLTLRATSLGDSVLIEVRDDGGGLDPDAVAARAKRLGVAVPELLDDAALLGIVTTPGFSTREQADRAAGRGIGMSVVANTVREFGGRLTLENRPGRGARFKLRLPLTLSIIDALILTVADETCALPQSAVEEIIQVPAQEVRVIQRTEVVPYRQGLLPLVRLREQFQLPAASAHELTVLVLQSERGETGLVVDRVRARREVVVRPLTDPLVRVPGVSGATELGDGRPILILDPAAFVGGVVRPPAAGATQVGDLSA